MRFLVLIVPLLSHYTYSQDKEIGFGEISREEIEMVTYDQDNDAKAVIIFDKGKSIFIDTERGYDIQFTRHKRIKIFDKSESQSTEISIPYYVDGYGKTEKIKSIEAITYNTTDGSLTRQILDPSTIYEERINERWYNKKFVFPDVQDGAILEYRYVLETPFHFNLPDWIFQSKIPTIYSEYQVSMIPFYEYVFLVQGISEFDSQTSIISKENRTWGTLSKAYGETVGNGVEFQDYVHTFILTDVPAFKDESYISSVNDYIIKMDFQLAKFNSPRGGKKEIISTWTALNESLLKHDKFGKYINSCTKIAKRILAEELDVSELNQTKKAKKIIEYVKNSFEWNGYYGKYATQSAKDFFTTKTGNTADINLFMIALLNQAGIKSKPMILSTRDHGKISSEYPFDHFTNYVIALVSTDSPFLADGTEPFLPYNRLPTKCNNEKGLIVEKEDVPRWISLNNNFLSIEKHTILMNIDTVSTDVMAQVTIQNTAYEAFAARKRFKNDSTRIKEFYSQKVGKIRRFKAMAYGRYNLPYSMNFVSQYETEKLGNNILIRPFLNLPIAKNNLTQMNRSYPVDFIYPWANLFETSLTLPSGFFLAEVPEGYQINDELAEVNLDYTFSDNVLTVKGEYKFKKSTYVANEYSRVKNYLDQIVMHFNQPIILEKRE